MTRTTRPLLAVLAVLVAALALAACGGDDSSGDSGGSGSASSESSETDAQLAFEECLRGKSIDIDISERGGMLMRAKADDGGPSAGSEDEARAAMDECRESSGWTPPEPSDEQRAEMRDRALEFARCMREQGVDVPDPAPDGRMTLRMDAGNREAFERASRACGNGSMAPAETTEP